MSWTKFLDEHLLQPTPLLISILMGWICASIICQGRTVTSNRYWVIVLFALITNMTISAIAFFGNKADRGESPIEIVFFVALSLTLFIVPPLLALFFTHTGINWYRKLFKHGKIRFQYHTKTAWQSFIGSYEGRVTQIHVYTKKGVTISSSHVDFFEESLQRGTKYHWGSDGSVSFYPTHIDGSRKGDNPEKILSSVEERAKWGEVITYIPAEEIERIDVRLKTDN